MTKTLKRFTNLPLFSLLGVLEFQAALFAAAPQEPIALPSRSHPIIVDTTRREVRILANYQPERFEGPLKFVPNYHLLVWYNGRAAGEALFATPAPDVKLIEALETIGGVAGNNLTMDAWNKRKEPDNPAPQNKIGGTPVEILVGWKGLEAPLPLAVLLDDPGGRGFDFHFGGNRALIPEWRSGCLVCLYSCPGAKVGNAAYTVRDYATGATKFRPRRERLPKNGSQVVIYFRVIK